MFRHAVTYVAARDDVIFVTLLASSPGLDLVEEY